MTRYFDVGSTDPQRLRANGIVAHELKRVLTHSHARLGCVEYRLVWAVDEP